MQVFPSRVAGESSIRGVDDAHEVVAVDVGGTHVRFASATIEGGRVRALAPAHVFKTSEHASLELAWSAFAASLARPLPRAAAIALAGAVDGEELRLTNNTWVIRPAGLRETLQLERYVVLNDFGAVAHAVDRLDRSHFRHLCGPERDLPAEGVISIVGPGTGLGVAQLVRVDGRGVVLVTEGGHTAFAPVDALEDRLLAWLRPRFGRVSTERLVSGSGLVNLHQALSALEDRATEERDAAELWRLALSGEDPLAVAALERFCLSLGSAAGDLALAHGAQAVVIAGGVGLHLAARLPRSGFEDRFHAKGRFETRMRAMPVKVVTHPQPGLFGAACAFADHCSD